MVTAQAKKLSASDPNYYETISRNDQRKNPYIIKFLAENLIFWIIFSTILELFIGFPSFSAFIGSSTLSGFIIIISHYSISNILCEMGNINGDPQEAVT